MKTVFSFILLFNICFSFEDSYDPKNYWKGYYDGVYLPNVKKHDGLYHENMRKHDGVYHANIRKHDGVYHANIRKHDGVYHANIRKHDEVYHENIRKHDGVYHANIRKHDEVYHENIRKHDGVHHANVKKHDDQEPHEPQIYHPNAINQPCLLDDLACIRRVFAQNSKCKPVAGPAKDPYMVERLDLPIPQANLTFTLLNAQVKGLNEWKIGNFYQNKATNTLVLEVVFDRIVVASPGARTTCHRKGKENIEVTDYSIIEYYGLSFTLTIPNIKDLQFSKRHVFTYVPDANPLYTLGPAVRNEKDPDFSKSVAVWLDSLAITMREVWETQGPAFMSMFLNSNICDFRHN